MVKIGKVESKQIINWIFLYQILYKWLKIGSKMTIIWLLKRYSFCMWNKSTGLIWFNVITEYWHYCKFFWIILFHSNYLPKLSHLAFKLNKANLSFSFYLSFAHSKTLISLTCNSKLYLESCKLLRLGIANPIVVVESNSDFKFDRRLTSIRISTIWIESTIAISIYNRSFFDIFSIKSIF